MVQFHFREVIWIETAKNFGNKDGKVSTYSIT